MGTIDGFSIVGDLFPDGWAAVCGLVWWESSSGRFGFFKRITETVREEKSARARITRGSVLDKQLW